MCLVRNLYLWTFQIQLCGNIKCIYVQKCKMLRYLRVCQNFTLCNQRLIGDNDMLLAEWSSKKILRNVFKVYNIIRHHRYSSTSPFLMFKIVAQNFHLERTIYMQRKEVSVWISIQIRFLKKKYLKITILVYWSQIVQTRIRIIIKIIFGRLMRISVRAHCRCIHLFPNRAHDASKITCAIYNCISVHLIFGIEFFVSVFWIDLL